MFKEFLKGLKWIALLFGVIIVLIALWLSCAWGLGWIVNTFFDLRNFEQSDYISFGSCIIIFILIVQIVTITLTGWVLYSWGRARGLINKK